MTSTRTPGRLENLRLREALRAEQFAAHNGWLTGQQRDVLEHVAATLREVAGFYAQDPTLAEEISPRTWPMDLAAELCRYVPGLLRAVDQGREPEAARSDLAALLERLDREIMPAAREQVHPDYAVPEVSIEISRIRLASGCAGRVISAADAAVEALGAALELPTPAPEAIELREMAAALAARAREIYDRSAP